jgi:CHAD domain-containing protein
VAIEIVDRVTPLLKDRVRGLFRQLPPALAGDEEAIHQMRVAGRRLRVALPLLARKPNGRRARRARRILQELTRAAGTSRDLDVGLGLFEARLKERAETDAERRLLRQRLRSARRRSRLRMAEALMDIDIARVRRDLRVVMSRRGELVFTALLRLREARDLRGTAILEALSALGDAFDPAALHRLRIRLRRLRYAAELAEKLTGQTTEAPGLFRGPGSAGRRSRPRGAARRPWPPPPGRKRPSSSKRATSTTAHSWPCRPRRPCGAASKRWALRAPPPDPGPPGRIQ